MLNIRQCVHAFDAEKAPDHKRMMLASLIHALLDDMIMCQMYCYLCCHTVEHHVAMQQAVGLAFR